MSELVPIVVRTVLLAGLTTTVVMLLGLPLAYLLARREFPGKRVISALTSLPLVLPPTAVGYLLLRLLADDGPLGRGSLGFDPGVLFTWKGVVVACSVMSAPLVVRAARLSFEGVDPKLEAMARSLGSSRTAAFRRVTLPLAARGLTAAAVLGFARALGEFGATVVVAGNIPGQTQTLASAIFSAQQAGRSADAAWLSLVALVVGFAAIMAAEWLALPRNRAGSGGTRVGRSPELN